MSDIRIIGNSLKNIPWEEKPTDCMGVVWRSIKNPLTSWNYTKSTSRIFNSGVEAWVNGFAGVFRADHNNGKPNLHFGFSLDGYKWDISDDIIQWKYENGKPATPSCAYDPRIVKIEDTYYILWCTDFGGSPAIGLGKTKDFKEFIRLENPTIPCNRNGVLFPRKIGGLYQLLSRPSDSSHTPFGDIYLSQSKDLVFWGKHKKVMSRGNEWWQTLKIGAGPAPIETTEGWLLFYHGVVNNCSGFVYSYGAAILDIDNPCKVLYRSKNFLHTPQASYEMTGYVPNVCFPCAAITDSDSGRIAIYYGCADTYIGLAFAKIDELINEIKENSSLAFDDGEEII